MPKTQGQLQKEEGGHPTTVSRTGKLGKPVQETAWKCKLPHPGQPLCQHKGSRVLVKNGLLAKNVTFMSCNIRSTATQMCLARVVKWERWNKHNAAKSKKLWVEERRTQKKASQNHIPVRVELCFYTAGNMYWLMTGHHSSRLENSAGGRGEDFPHHSAIKQLHEEGGIPFFRTICIPVNNMWWKSILCYLRVCIAISE